MRRASRRSAAVLLISLLLGAPPGAAAAEPARALTLPECYELALARSERIAISQELIKETEGRFMQAFSGVLPRVSFELSEKREDGDIHTPEQTFTFSQPLFSGFREFAALAGSRAERRQRKHEKARAEQLLLLDVSDAFYLLLQLREELGALDISRVALLQRIDELRQREQLGRSRPSEVVSAEAQLRRVEAELVRIQGLETTARQLLEFLTGLERIDVVADDGAAVPSVEEERAYLLKAGVRPDVLAAAEEAKIQKHERTVAQADLWPDVDLEGNYYTKRVGTSADREWDVLLVMDVPLFQGGQTVGAIREAASKARQAALELARVERTAMLEIRKAYLNLQTALVRRAALDQARQAAEDDYRFQVEDYRLNLVNNLDVLKSLQALQDARREAVQARYEAKRRYWALRVAGGEAL